MHSTMPSAFPGLKQPARISADQNTQSIKIKKAGSQGVNLVVILDESSSMNSAWDSTLEGFNEWLDKQKSELKGQNAFLTVVKFNGSNVWNIRENVPLQDCEYLTKNDYAPSGMTNLLDAIGMTVEKINERLASLKKKDRFSPIFIVFTDGHENSSQSYTGDGIKNLVSDCEEKEWAFTFFGANIDAFAVGSKLGFSASNTIQYSTSGMKNTMRAAGAATARFASAKLGGMSTQDMYATQSYTGAERSQAMTSDASTVDAEDKEDI